MRLCDWEIKYLIYIISLNPHFNSMMLRILKSFYRLGVWNLEKLNDLHKVQQLEGGETLFKASSETYAWAFSNYPIRTLCYLDNFLRQYCLHITSDPAWSQPSPGESRSTVRNAWHPQMVIGVASALSWKEISM